MWFFDRDPQRETARKLARARKFLQTKDYNEVRLELEGVEGEEAQALCKLALAELVRINLDEARFRMATGERDEVGGAIARARRFGASDEEIRSLRHWRVPDETEQTPMPPPTARRRGGGGGAPPPL